MAKVEVGKGRSWINDTGAGLKIIIPAKKNYFVMLFLSFWLVGWAFGEVTTLTQVINPESHAPKLFLIAWVGGWTVGGVFAIYAWLWSFMGKEVINVSASELQHIRAVAGFKRSKEYDIASVSKLRVQPQNSSIFGSRNGLEFWGISGGSIAFDYGHSTYKFGAQLDEAEASYIVSEIKQRYKNL